MSAPHSAHTGSATPVDVANVINSADGTRGKYAVLTSAQLDTIENTDFISFRLAK